MVVPDNRNLILVELPEPRADVVDDLTVRLAELRGEFRRDVHRVRHARVNDDLVVPVAGRGDGGVRGQCGAGRGLQVVLAVEQQRRAGEAGQRLGHGREPGDVGDVLLKIFQTRDVRVRVDAG